MPKKTVRPPRKAELPKIDHGPLQQIVAGLSEGVVLVDPDGSIDWANAVALEVHGVARVEELGGNAAGYRRRFRLAYRNHHALTAAQLLLTLDDLEDRRRYLNAAATLGRLLNAGAVPVVNENDSVATAEIRFGDNDRLAARVAQAANAGGVLLLSDVDGLYDRNPADPDARLLPQVHGVTAEIFAMADARSTSGMGSGGMTSKLQAAEIAERAGIALAIVNGTHAAPIARALSNGTGTLFLPRRKDAARKAWLGGRMRLKGVLTVDPGCAAALAKGGSLLATGVTKVEGDFERGDPVSVLDTAGRPIAQGLAEYAAVECERLKGRRSDEHAAILGYAPRSAVIHRDQLVLL